MNRFLTGTALAAALAISTPTASAHDATGAIVGGILGGLAVGGIVGGALAQPDYYQQPGYYPVQPGYYAPRRRRYVPQCWVEQQAMWDGWQYVYQPVQVCR